MIDYTKEVTLHIEGLGMNFYEAFQEREEITQVDIPPDVDIHSISIQKIGGYKPQLVHLVYLDQNNQEQQQAYMAHYFMGNLVCTPVKEPLVNHSFSQECTLSGHPIGIILHISSKYINQENNLIPNDANSWISIYQEGILRLINPYVLDTYPTITYLHT